MLPQSKFIRQSGLVDERIFETPVCVIGAGGIGSFTTLALAKCGFNAIDVWDFDKVEEHNLPNQFYPIKAIGRDKVVALKEEVSNWCDVDINTHGKWSGKVDEMQGVVIAAVDSMKMRSAIWKAVLKNKLVTHLVDGRMGANQLEVYSCNMNNATDIKRYKSTLCTDSQAADVACTQRAVMYNVLNIASWITNQVRLILSEKDYKREMIMDLENMILVLPEESVPEVSNGS